MNSGSIALDTPIDLQQTLESGFTFLWQRTDNGFFSSSRIPSDEWYFSATPSETVFVQPAERKNGLCERLRWVASCTERELEKRLRLFEPLSELDTSRIDSVGAKAIEQANGLRVPREPITETLFSFICSSNMRVERIHKMQVALSEKLGDTTEWNGYHVNVYPSVEQFCEADIEVLNSSKLGYRSGWIRSTAEMVAEDGFVVNSMMYPDARSELQRFAGVGKKVGDCIVLYAGINDVAVPIDTRIKQFITEEYGMEMSGYTESRQFLQNVWGPKAGLVQAAVFAQNDNS